LLYRVRRSAWIVEPLPEDLDRRTPYSLLATTSDMAKAIRQPTSGARSTERLHTIHFASDTLLQLNIPDAELLAIQSDVCCTNARDAARLGLQVLEPEAAWLVLHYFHRATGLFRVGEVLYTPTSDWAFAESPNGQRLRIDSMIMTQGKEPLDHFLDQHYAHVTKVNAYVEVRWDHRGTVFTFQPDCTTVSMVPCLQAKQERVAQACTVAKIAQRAHELMQDPATWSSASLTHNRTVHLSGLFEPGQTVITIDKRLGCINQWGTRVIVKNADRQALTATMHSYNEMTVAGCCADAPDV
jgi:hypothetical protein